MKRISLPALFPAIRHLQKCFLIMRLMFICIFSICMQVSAKVYSQDDTRLSFNLQDVKLEKALSAIEKKSNYRFFFNNKEIPVDKRIDLKASNASLEEVLGIALAGLNLSYKILDNRVVLVMPYGAPAQNRKLTGIVTDEHHQPLAGVTVKVSGSNVGTVTGTDGRFEIEVPDNNAVLQFSFIGYATQTVAVDGHTELVVALKEGASSLNEVVVVGYGTQKKTSVTAAISSVDGDEIVRAPVANVSNTLGGRVSGVLSRQSSGEPGSDADQVRIRGIGTTGNASPLVVVDGIPMNYDQLNPNEIESITVLKDAAAVAPYGLAGANGVILVTTKRGKEGRFALYYDGYYGIQRPTAIPRFLDAYDYAKQLSQANQNIGNQPTYTEDQLQKFKDGSDPDHYPNTDWVHEIINFHSPITRHTLSFTGGTQKLRLYSDLGYLYQEGVVDVINFKRYNATVNVDVDVTPTTTVSFDINGALTRDNNPAGRDGTAIFTDVTEIPPILPLQFSNGLPAHTMLPSIYQSGYDRNTNNILNAKFQLQQNIPFIPGLSLKGVFAYHKNYTLEKVWTLPYIFYALNAQDEFAVQHAGPPAPTLAENFTETQNITMQGYITYQHSFGKHDIGGLVVYEGQRGDNDKFAASRINYAVLLDELSLGSSSKNDLDNSGSSGRSAQNGWVYRLTYAYAGKYLAEFSGRYDGHYYFAPGKRYAFFPSVSLGWRLSEEHFIKDNFPWIDNLKLRGSYGKSGNLAGSAFQYLTSYGLGASYIFGGTAPYQVQGIFENAQANPNITWETAKKADIGLDATLWGGQLDLAIDFFKERRSDMLLNPVAVVPLEYGIGISQVNAGIMSNKGFDASLGTDQRFGNGFRLNAAFNFSYASNKLIQTFESASTYNNPNRRRTGRPYNTQFGLKALGLYQESDFDDNGVLKKGEPVPSFGPVAPGDVKYADIAGPPGPDGKPTAPDGKIDVANDETVIGHPQFPEIIFGLNLGLSWKNISLTMLWQGAGNSTNYLLDELAFPFYNGAKMSEEQMDYWTPQNTDAAYTRLTPTPITNDIQTSSFWTRKGTYLRLKTLELGYALPASVVKAMKMQAVRVFVSGQDLLTFSQEKSIDPEMGNNRDRYYFQQKIYAFGLKVGF